MREGGDGTGGRKRPGWALVNCWALFSGSSLFATAVALDLTEEKSVAGQVFDAENVTLAAWATAIALSVTGTVLFLIWLYRCWSTVPAADRRCSPGAAVGLLFVPLFNLYWIFVAIVGLSSSLGRSFGRQYARPPGLKLARAVCIFTILFGLLGVVCTGLELIPWVLLVAWVCVTNDAKNRLLSGSPAEPQTARSVDAIWIVVGGVAAVGCAVVPLGMLSETETELHWFWSAILEGSALDGLLASMPAAVGLLAVLMVRSLPPRVVGVAVSALAVGTIVVSRLFSSHRANDLGLLEFAALVGAFVGIAVARSGASKRARRTGATVCAASAAIGLALVLLPRQAMDDQHSLVLGPYLQHFETTATDPLLREVARFQGPRRIHFAYPLRLDDHEFTDVNFFGLVRRLLEAVFFTACLAGFRRSRTRFTWIWPLGVLALAVIPFQSWLLKEAVAVQGMLPFSGTLQLKAYLLAAGVGLLLWRGLTVWIREASEF